MSGNSALTDFLLARIAEDEAMAKGAAEVESGSWWVDGPAEVSRKFWVYATGEKFERREVAEHIARHDPARVLAECEAKRRIVEGVVPERDPYRDHPDYDADWVLKDLASVYAEHPDYRQEWKA